ncbi:MAG: uroporphyrinogen decarboxylase, partial [candidate division NC10 bacterium]|nr:uroporphyrinogen decarboxylase [candidate division NC10 bacterium]
MRKPERVLAALASAPVDHPPFSVWYHFGLQHLPGRALAGAELAFYRHYDPD